MGSLDGVTRGRTGDEVRGAQPDTSASVPLVGEHALTAEQIDDFLVVGHIGMHMGAIAGKS